MAVSEIFLDFAKKIHAKATPADPNFLSICVMTGKIEAWAEHHYPSFVTISKESKIITYKSVDPRSKIVLRERELEKERTRREKGDEAAEKILPRHEFSVVPWQLYLFILGGIGILFAVTALGTVGLLYYFYGHDWSWDDIPVVDGAKEAIEKGKDSWEKVLVQAQQGK